MNGASGVRVRLWSRVLLKYVVADALNYDMRMGVFQARVGV